MPVCALILTGIDARHHQELYEAMALDGATTRRVFFQLVVPLSKGGIVHDRGVRRTPGVERVPLPAGADPVGEHQGDHPRALQLPTEYGVDIPALLAAVVLSIVPVLLVYLFARRPWSRG